MGRRRPLLLAAQLMIGTGCLLAGLLTHRDDCWTCLPLFVLAAFCAGSEWLVTRLDGEGGASGSLLGIVLAAVLYGPGPAMALAVFIVCAGWPRTREPARTLAGNLGNAAGSALIAALFFQSIAGMMNPHVAFDYLAVFLTFLVALAANLVGVVLLSPTRRSPAQAARLALAMLRPVLSAELASAVLTVTAVWVIDRLHLAGLVMFGLVLAIFQYLVGELLTSRRRGARLRRIATTDELTGLANRERFRQAIEERIAGVPEAEPGFGVLLMDLDRFKEINDTLGHSYGDGLLRDLGPRLQRAIGPDGCVARLGGDEFGILPGHSGHGPEALEGVITRLLAVVGEPFEVDELALEIGASVGVARYPLDGADSHALMRCADIAMYAAKDAQTDFKLYSAEQNAHSMRRLSVLSDIRRALAGDEIVVHYQPIVELGSRAVTGAEGLVRWEHPDHGLIPPGAFVQTVEQSGLIGPLTRRVLDRAIAQCAEWRRSGRELSVAVNLSVRNLLDRDLPREIDGMLRAHGVPAAALQLEITESMIMSDPERALGTVSRLSALGVRLSVDDFGTGYSSLANLRRLPIDELKIDRSFVSPMLRDESDLIIVRSTINLGHDLGLRIIAEGVEDGATLERLAALGCDQAQGFHLSRPLPGPAFERWLDGTPAPDAAPASGWAARAGVVLAAPEL